jgi:Tfp pilus assembly PilM family ATPase
LALDSDATRIHFVSATVKGSSVKLESAYSWDETPLTIATADAIGRRLRERLKEAGVSPAPLLVCVGRDRLVFKEIKHPPVPARDEPAVVRFQAMKELTEGVDGAVIDYVSMRSLDTPDSRRAMVVACRREFIDAVKQMCNAAGLKLAGVSPRPFALLAGLQSAINMQFVPPVDPAGSAIALLVRGDKWGEFQVARNQQTILARPLPAPAVATDAALLNEIRRNLAIHSSQSPDQPVRTLYLAEADSPGGLRERLRSTLAIPVHAYDPLVGVAAADGFSGGLAGAAGLIALRAISAELPVNLAEPKEPKPQVDPNRRLYAMAGALVAVLVLALGTLAYRDLSKKGDENRRLLREKTEMEQQLITMAPEVARIKALDDWLAADVNWLDEFYDLTARFKDNDRMRLVQITGNALESKSDRGKYVANLTINGVYSDPRPMDEFKRLLSLEGAYDVPPMTLKANQGPDRFRFAQTFEAKLNLLKRPKEKYELTFTAKAPAKRKLDFDDGDFGGFGP